MEGYFIFKNFSPSRAAAKALKRKGRLRCSTGGARLQAERLESRLFLSVSAAALLGHKVQAHSGAIVYHAPKRTNPSSTGAGVSPNAVSVSAPFNPAEIRHAYGMDQVSFGAVQGSGAGQTIAIVDAYDSPTAWNDLQQFDKQYNLPDPQFTRVAQDGTANYPSTDPKTGSGNTWEVETDLDLQWAHAMAPQANLLLVEANSSSLDDLITAAVGYARTVAGVSVVSMSFGGGEFSGETSFYDSTFTTPAGHTGITFIASTGDNGAPAEYPAFSPNVVAVGGTSLTFDSSGNYFSESGWSGSGGSVSTVVPQPSYQKGVVTQSTRRRAAPDVSMDADPNTGVSVYDSYDFASSPWIQVGGTSLSAPMWAGLMAVVDQGRVVNGMGSLNGRNETLPKLYALPAADFHDVVAGNNGNAAGTGYDLVTGLGTPVANKLVYDLAGIQASVTPAPLTINGTSGNDVIYLKSDGTNLDVWLNSSTPGSGTPTSQYALSTISSLAIAGGGGADNVVFDESGSDIFVIPTSTANGGGSIALTLIGSTAADSVFIHGDSNSIAFNSHSLTFSNVTAIAYWDSAGGDIIETAGAIPVTIDTSGNDNLIVDSGNPTINFVDPGSSPTFAGPITPSVAQPATSTPSANSASAARKAYRPAHRATSRFSAVRI